MDIARLNCPKEFVPDECRLPKKNLMQINDSKEFPNISWHN